MEGEEGVVTGSTVLTKADFRHAITHVSGLFRVRWLVVVALAGGVISVVATPASLDASQTGVWLVAMGAFVVTLFVEPYRLAAKSLRALTNGGDAQVLFRFDREGVTIRATGATASFAYRVVSRYRETRQALAIYTNPSLPTIIPHRAFTTADLARVRALLASNVKADRGIKPLKIAIVWAVLVFLFVVVWQVLNAKGTAPPPR